MNLREVPSLSAIIFRAWRAITIPLPGGKIRAFGPASDQISAIVVVNLDRQPERWRQIRRELGRFRTSHGDRLTTIARRQIAIDARDGRAVAATSDVDPMFTVGDQLYVQPDERLAASFARSEPVRMTRQEVAVARSHVEAWKAIALGTDTNVLILEDDAWFRPWARKRIESGWRGALRRGGEGAAPRLVYLSYSDAGGTATRVDEYDRLFRPIRGLWFLSGYVLSRQGAEILLRAMPVVGPVDLWMNYRFDQLHALALETPAIAQRSDARSENSYSILPYLARAGVVDAKRGIKPPDTLGTKRVLAWTAQLSHEGLAMALSMLGLRVRVFDESDDALGRDGLDEAFRTFDALIDPNLSSDAQGLALRDHQVTILIEVNSRPPQSILDAELDRRRLRILKSSRANEIGWDEICDLLAVTKPAEAFPKGAPREYRLFRLAQTNAERMPDRHRAADRFRADESPWVLPTWRRRRPMPTLEQSAGHPGRLLAHAGMTRASRLFPSVSETFPGNLASFVPEALEYGNRGMRIVLDSAVAGPRRFRSGAFESTQQFTHGRFQAEIRAAPGPGLVTGFFLHRSSPRQEIDIEIVGSSPRRLLTNVFYNPGDSGAALAYGYRGSPFWIDLEFDATEDFHEYAIDWRPDRVTWLVDGNAIHERDSWDPTPVPHLAMRIHGNLWAPRSHELAGRVDSSALPSSAMFRNLLVTD